ncbi:MAG TPA: cyclase family protein [Ignavibacteria bacterium]|nr:cyclase family protein [Ignavibacteria bacterium]HMR40850.1 cyclase family protein [Ignavibacteria bacterium]
MKINFNLHNTVYSCDTSKPIEISIPVMFNSEQPNTYNVDKATANAYEAGDFIGDTRRGGGCNFEEYRIIPHCNGTHTECVGHISLERISVNEILKESFFLSKLITVTPEKATDTIDNYSPDKNENDLIVTRKLLQEKLEETKTHFPDALVIRTLPNDDSKRSRNYMENLPPFFSLEAMEYIRSLNVQHLLIDIPSVDRTFDEGKLSTHHIYWGVEQGSHEVSKKKHSLKTITEMIYVPEKITDGDYLLNIQIPDFVADAAPSRICLFRLMKQG